jgi:hypothetical protein
MDLTTTNDTTQRRSTTKTNAIDSENISKRRARQCRRRAGTSTPRRPGPRTRPVPISFKSSALLFRLLLLGKNRLPVVLSGSIKEDPLPPLSTRFDWLPALRPASGQLVWAIRRPPRCPEKNCSGFRTDPNSRRRFPGLFRADGLSIINGFAAGCSEKPK